jgi:DNA-binding CsgD family transcriptional regulator
LASDFDALSAKQKDCLRLVAEGLTSKQIAPKVGLTHESVNTYVKTATRIVGAPNRSVAARMLLEYEAIPKREFPSQPIAEPASARQIRAADELPGSPRPTSQGLGILALVPPLGGSDREMTVGETMAAMLRAALFLAVIVATLLLLIVGGLKLL